MLGNPRPARAAALATGAALATVLIHPAAASAAPAPIVVDRAEVPVAWELQYSDSDENDFSADGGQSTLVAIPTGLPAGVTLTGGDGDWTIDAVPTADPGSYPVHIDVTDGTTTTGFDTTLVVTPEDATAVYTGPTKLTGNDFEDDEIPFTATAQVTEAADGEPGDLSRATVTFVDTVEDTDLCVAPVNAAGAASCAAAADVFIDPKITMQIALEINGVYEGGSLSNATVVAELPDDPEGGTGPETKITAGPDGWLAGTSATFALKSDADVEGELEYVCKLDNAKVPCSGKSVTLNGLKPGTHKFTAAGIDEDGEVDDTPAVRDFAVLYDDTALAGKWKRKKDNAAYQGTVTETKKKARTLTYKVKDARELALLIQTGKKAGAVKVYLDDTLLATVKTAGGGGSKVVKVGRFNKAASGVLKVVATTGKTVRLDGLGVSTSAF